MVKSNSLRQQHNVERGFFFFLSAAKRPSGWQKSLFFLSFIGERGGYDGSYRVFISNAQPHSTREAMESSHSVYVKHVFCLFFFQFEIKRVPFLREYFIHNPAGVAERQLLAYKQLFMT